MLTCATVAFWLKEVFDAEGLESFAKVSGSKGMQVYVPLNTAVTYEQTQPFARGLAQRLEREHPELVVSEMAKAKRTGKVFIDWSQNSDFKTTVSVYSLRAKREEPYVSMPVTWDELRRAARRRDAAAAELRSGVGAGAVGEGRGPLGGRADAEAEAAARRRKGDRRRPTRRAKFIEPMRAALVAELPEGPQWQYEIKFDGYRALGVKTRGEVELLSRNNLKLNARFPENCGSARGAGRWDDSRRRGRGGGRAGPAGFNALQNSQRSSQPIFYYVFDCLELRGREPAAPAVARTAAVLEELPLADPVRISQTLDASRRTWSARRASRGSKDSWRNGPTASTSRARAAARG